MLREDSFLSFHLLINSDLTGLIFAKGVSFGNNLLLEAVNLTNFKLELGKKMGRSAER